MTSLIDFPHEIFQGIFVLLGLYGMTWCVYFARLALAQRRKEKFDRKVEEIESFLGADMGPRPIPSYQPGD